MKRRPARRGLILILVLLVIAMLSLGAYAFTSLMLAQREAAAHVGRQAQARSLVDSGVAAVQLFLAQTAEEQQQAGGIYDNRQAFQAVLVADDPDPRERGCFSVLAPAMDASGNVSGVRFGLEDESTRLNLNVLLVLDQQMPGAGRQLLMALPGMTEDVADAILDWLDADDQPREFGAEIEYYSGLTPPYGPKNGPLDTVEELLLVRGVTPQLLFGVDSNRNGQLDGHEMLSSQNSQMTDPAAFRGWSAYLTLHSVEWNLTPQGQPRVYLNTSDLNKLVSDLEAVGFPAEWITFIVAYRQMGPMNSGQSSPALLGAANPTGTLNMDLQPQFPIGQVLDLAGVQVQYQFVGATTPVVLNSPFSLEGAALWLPTLMDYVTVNPAATIPGRININQAPAVVLYGIPGMTPELVDAILSKRDVTVGADDPARRHETWLLAEGLVTLEQMKALTPFITGGGRVFRAQVVGYYQGGQASSRAEVIFDATSPLPRIVLWRDLSHLGRGYSIETLGANWTR